MKPLVVFIVLLSISSNVFSQRDDKLFYLQKSEKYARMKNTGRTLTIVGGAVWIVGIVTAANSTITTTSNGYGTQTSTTGNPQQAAIELIFGTAALGAGIPLWIVGSHNERKYNRLQTLTMRPYFAPQQQGLTLRYRF